MGKKKVARRSKVKPFIKVVNYSHLLPTRYQLELESLKGSVSAETFKEPTQRSDSKKAIKKAFEERYAKGQNRWCMLEFIWFYEGLAGFEVFRAIGRREPVRGGVWERSCGEGNCLYGAGVVRAYARWRRQRCTERWSHNGVQRDGWKTLDQGKRTGVFTDS